MVDNPRPTRAEMTDVANAVLDGASGLMLCSETAYGMFPADSAATAASIVRNAEHATSYQAMHSFIRWGLGPGPGCRNRVPEYSTDGLAPATGMLVRACATHPSPLVSMSSYQQLPPTQPTAAGTSPPSPLTRWRWRPWRWRSRAWTRGWGCAWWCRTAARRPTWWPSTARPCRWWWCRRSRRWCRSGRSSSDRWGHGCMGPVLAWRQGRAVQLAAITCLLGVAGCCLRPTLPSVLHASPGSQARLQVRVHAEGP